MKKSETIIRVLLGLLILVSGVNKFGYWINTAYMEDALDFVVNFTNLGGGLFIYAMGILEIAIGLCLIIDRFKLLAILALVPLMIFILMFHLFLDLKGILIAATVFGLNIILLYIHRNSVSGLFAAKT